MQAAPGIVADSIRRRSTQEIDNKVAAQILRASRRRTSGRAMSGQVLVIDNYDSFTYNLVQYLGELGADGARARATTRSRVDEIAARQPDAHRHLAGPVHAGGGRHLCRR